MVGFFQVGSSVTLNQGMVAQDSSVSDVPMSMNGTVLRVYGDDDNPICDVGYGNGSVVTGIRMSDLNS